MIKYMPDEAIVFVAMFEKSEGEEHIVENFTEGKDFPITNEQWADLVDNMDKDESMWIEISDCWRTYLERLYTKSQEGVNA